MHGRTPLPACTLMCNMLVRDARRLVEVGRRHGGWYQHGIMRNIQTGQPAIVERLHIGEVARHGSCTFIHTMEGRKTNAGGAAMRIRKGGHHQGMNLLKSGAKLSLPSHVRLVYLDTRKIRRCSYNSVASHSFAWPSGPGRSAKRAKAIVRTLMTNHCKWFDVLIVRGRCFSKRKYNFHVDRILDMLLDHWGDQDRPFIVHPEGNDDVVVLPKGCKKVVGDPYPMWLDDDEHCVWCGPRLAWSIPVTVALNILWMIVLQQHCHVWR